MKFFCGVVVLLFMGIQLKFGECQEIYSFLEDLANRQAYLSTVKENPDVLDEVEKAMEAIGQLWNVYMLEVLKNTSSTISEACANSTLRIIEPLLPKNRTNLTTNSVNSMKLLIPLLDATGKPGAGLLGGNLYLVPSFDECFDYNYTAFCQASVKLTSLPKSSLFVWNVGLCVPKYCSSSDVSLVMNQTKKVVVHSNAIKCTNEKEPSYSPGAIVMIVVCFIFIALVCLSTLIDWISQNIGNFTLKDKTLQINGETGLTKSDISEKIPLLAHSSTQRPSGFSKVMNFVTAFSLYKTIPTLLATKQAPSVISSLNGMRVISLFWVIMGHVHLAVFHQNGGATNNALELKVMASRFSYQPLLNAFPAVDTFFFLSGVLVAYLTLRHTRKRGGFPFIHYYAHRYLRLTPAYAFVLFFYWQLTNHITSGPAFALAPENSCAKYWWTNMLYINNFYPWKLKDECMAWTWYLANDMQFYVISPLILLPLYYLFPVGVVIAATMLLCGFAITGSLAGVYDFQASNFVRFAYTNYTFHYDPEHSVTDLLYVKPYARISPYIVGLMLGYLFYEGIRPQFGRLLNWLAYLGMWIASGLILVPVLYGLYFIWHGHIMTKAENILYLTFSRFAWGVGLALVVYACHNGYGGLINTFLSLKIWTPLARMTYNAYLIHLIVIGIVYGQTQAAIHLTDITMAIYTIAIVAISYALAAAVCLCVEFPLGSIEMQIFELIGLGGRVTQRQGAGVTQEKMED